MRRSGWSQTLAVIVLQSGGVSEGKTVTTGKVRHFLGKQAARAENGSWKRSHIVVLRLQIIPWVR